MNPLDSLFKDVLEIPVADFVQRYPDPVLVLEARGAFGRADSFQTVRASGERPAFAEAVLGSERPTLLPVRKRARSKFGNMISVGRTASNDVVVEHASVSKFHAYFLSRGENAWHVQDANSSNGTFVDGKRVPTDVPVPVDDGAAVQFSQDTRYRFFRPAALHRFLNDTLSRDNRPDAS